MPMAITDASFLMDVFFTHRANHATAAQLADLMIERSLKCRIPMHGIFELTSAIMCEKRIHGSLSDKSNKRIDESRPLVMEHVPIDQAFITKYMVDEIPDLKSGDMIYVVIARVDGQDLITEDKKMYAEAKRLGVSVFTAQEYIAHLASTSTDAT
ncbi:hypothetical protein MYX82_13850 [Acidobacteria bacterium AH-259-D05]|nr:hypothetical protein [Acidobacteria bacterium AH-259-D05]